MSYANLCEFVKETYNTSQLCYLKRIGKRSEPWGTPEITGSWLRSFKYLLTKLTTQDSKLKSLSNLSHNISQFMLSNALEKSSRSRTFTNFRSVALRTSSEILKSVVVVVTCAKSWLKGLLPWMWEFIWFSNTLSKTLESAHRMLMRRKQIHWMANFS